MREQAMREQAMKAKDRKTAAKGVSLQHRHFAFIAGALRDLRPTSYSVPFTAAQWDLLVDAFADRLAGTNSNFDRKRFVEACGGLIPIQQ